MKIYTRRGDAGQTSLFTGERVPKDEARLEALGSIDELVAHLGLARAETKDEGLRLRLQAIQGELYLLLADIAATAVGSLDASRAASRLPEDVISILESYIDEYEAQLPPLRDFVMPGESRASATFHIARTVCRRAERRVTTIARAFPLAERIPAYLNRLSDLLFVMARITDHQAGVADRAFKSAI
jgi:cob(I)alamin adenosyltransferase